MKDSVCTDGAIVGNVNKPKSISFLYRHILFSLHSPPQSSRTNKFQRGVEEGNRLGLVYVFSHSLHCLYFYPAVSLYILTVPKMVVNN